MRDSSILISRSRVLPLSNHTNASLRNALHQLHVASHRCAHPAVPAARKWGRAAPPVQPARGTCHAGAAAPLRRTLADHVAAVKGAVGATWCQGRCRHASPWHGNRSGSGPPAEFVLTD
jgi:hypothetical protein